jgi:hypothetical protein
VVGRAVNQRRHSPACFAFCPRSRGATRSSSRPAPSRDGATRHDIGFDGGAVQWERDDASAVLEIARREGVRIAA